MTVKVSIGMPVYNGGDLISYAISSLLAQTYSDFELIISDNCSEDRTSIICKAFAEKDNRIRYYRQSQNIGAAPNFEFVLTKATGEFFMWAAHDDLWTPGYLQSSICAFDGSSAKYSFPLFKLKSIFFGFSYLPNHNRVFSFLGSPFRSIRILRLINLHHSTHKCNLVYSLFRTNFIKSVYCSIDIRNDGALACVIASRSHCVFPSGEYFIKRYKLLWPGAIVLFDYILGLRRRRYFNKSKQKALSTLVSFFPELKVPIKYIFERYKLVNFPFQVQIVRFFDIPPLK